MSHLKERMPPKPGKKEPKGPTAKTINKEKAKIVDDKTFGLKNKNKSKAVQSYVKQVTGQVMFGGDKKVCLFSIFCSSNHG